MSDAFVKIDLHGLTQEEAIKVIDRALASAGPTTYQLRTMIYDEYKYEPKIKRIIPGDNPGITVMVLKELY